MVRTYSKEVSSTELVTGIIGTFDVSGTIAEIVRLTEDVKRAETEFQRLQNIASYMSALGLDEWRKIGLMNAEQILSMSSSKLNTALTQINNEIWNSLVNSAGGLKVTANIYSQIGKLLAQNLGLGFWFDAAISQIQEKTLEKISRYWNKVLGWNNPTVNETLEMFRRGLISFEEHVANIQESLGYDAEDARKVAQTQFKTLSLREAFIAYKRGLISLEQFKALYKANGYDEKDFSLIYNLLLEIPSVSDLIRICDYVELPASYIEETLRKNGFSETAINYIKTAIARRPLREEMRSLTTLLNYNYYRGYMSHEDYVNALNKLRILPEEKTLNMMYAGYRREQYKLELMIDIVEQKTRKGYYKTINEIEDALVNIGVERDIANLMAAKWYYQYVV